MTGKMLVDAYEREIKKGYIFGRTKPFNVSGEVLVPLEWHKNEPFVRVQINGDPRPSRVLANCVGGRFIDV